MSTRDPSLTGSISIVIPVFNGAATIGPLVDQLTAHYGDLPELEIILVNDGSSDGSAATCRELVGRYPGSVRFLDLSRNFGEHQAILAGLNRSSGDAVVIMEDDFQSSPEDVGKLIETLHAGSHDVVYGQFEVMHYSWLRRLASRLNDRMATLLLGKPRDLYLSSFKCLSRFLVDEVCRYQGPFPYLDGLILRVTRNIGVVACEHRPRSEGSSGYTIRKLLALWLNMFTNFSILPLRLAVVAGFGFAFLGGLLSIGVVIEKIWLPNWIPHTASGWPSTIIIVMTFAGLQLMVLGMIGEYLGRVFLSSNRTPQFAVREEHGFDEPR
ncbi:MAG: glycosyltransferase family 2 protein [Acidobacteriota bacterium]